MRVLVVPTYTPSEATIMVGFGPTYGAQVLQLRYYSTTLLWIVVTPQ